MNSSVFVVGRRMIPVAGLVVFLSIFSVALDAAAQTGDLQGVVTDAVTGEAVDGAFVFANGGSSGSGHGGGFHGFHARTDSSGFYSMEGLPEGDYNLGCGAHGYLLAEAQTTVEAGQVSTVDFALETLAFGEVAGTVTDASSGEPIAGAHVKLHRDLKEGSSGGLFPFFAVTGDDGTYAIDGVPAGDYLAVSMAWGYMTPDPAAVTVEEGASATVDFALEPITFGALEGLVTDSSTGEPVAGARVRLFSGWSQGEARSGEGRWGYYTAITDDNGFYRIEEITAGSYQVRASAHGYVPAAAEIDVVDGETAVLDLFLDPMAFGAVSGTVADAASGQPIADAMVMLFRGGGGGGCGDVRGQECHVGWLRAITDDNGAFTIDEALAGEYMLSVWAEGYSWMDPVAVTVVEGQTTTVDVVLELMSFGSVEGSVVDATTGDPVADALVFGRRARGGESALQQEHGGFARAVTDDDGFFSMEGLASGTWELTVFAWGYDRFSVEVAVEADQVTTVELPLDPR